MDSKCCYIGIGYFYPGIRLLSIIINNSLRKRVYVAHLQDHVSRFTNSDSPEVNGIMGSCIS